jgi:hypothetical protein
MDKNPWQRLPDRPPFVLPEDKEAVETFNAKAPKDYKLRIDDLLPEPFVGDPHAPVVLLGNNPGYTAKGAARKKEPRFVARMLANLRHAASDYPFVFFAPDIDEALQGWWDRKLKELLPFGRAVLARSLLAVEHFPYPSRRYGRKLPHLPSGAQDYSFSLVKKALERKAIIVLTRGERRWLRDVPALRTYGELCMLRNPQVASISRGNCDRFQEIEQAIESHGPLEGGKRP